MNINPRAGQLAAASDLVDVPKLISAPADLGVLNFNGLPDAGRLQGVVRSLFTKAPPRTAA